MSEFLFICEYFGITPTEFFDENIKNPEQVQRLLNLSKNMSNDDLAVLVNMAERLSKTDDKK